MAEFELERRRERVEEDRRDKRGRGGHLGGDAPLGYRVEGSGREARLVEDPAGQAAIRTMREMRASGASLRAIAVEVAARHGMNRQPRGRGPGAGAGGILNRAASCEEAIGSRTLLSPPQPCRTL